MAAPLRNEDRTRIIEYLKMQDTSDLSGREIAELIEKNTGIHVSQPTASKLKYEAEEECAGQISIGDLPMGFENLKQSCREFFSNEGINILYEMARTGTNREKLEAIRLIIQYGYGRPNNQPDHAPSMPSFL
jgi:hypothetical protein